MKIEINLNAPVTAQAEIFVNASLEKVWQALSDVEKWPEWQSDITEARMMGELAEGSIFKWKAGGIRLTSRLHTVSPFSSLGWTGRTFGASAIHNWRLQPHEQGTRVKVEESLAGLLPSLFRKKFSKDLKTGMQKNLEELKARAEKIQQ